jgi:hypothetical protein
MDICKQFKRDSVFIYVFDDSFNLICESTWKVSAQEDGT